MRALRKAFEAWRLKIDAEKVIERLQKAIAMELAEKQNHSQVLVTQLKERQEVLKRELAKQQEIHARHDQIRSRIVEAEEKLA